MDYKLNLGGVRVAVSFVKGKGKKILKAHPFDSLTLVCFGSSFGGNKFSW